MKRITALTDALRRTTAYTLEALDKIGLDGYDYQACVERVQQGLQEQVALSKDYQKHLDNGTLLDAIEVYTQTSYDAGTYYTTEYWRLLPGEDVPHQLSGYRGYFDALDASRDRRDEWPDAVCVSPQCFYEAVNESYRQNESYFRQCFNERENEG